MLSSDDETTDWQREMAAEIRAWIEAASAHRSCAITTGHRVSGDSYVPVIEAEPRPSFSVPITTDPSKLPDHIPQEVNGVLVEKEVGTEVLRFTLNCRLVTYDSGSGFTSLVTVWYRCEVVE